MKRKLKVGIIGCGRIAGLLQDDPLREGIVTHMGAYQSFPKQVEVVACCSRTKKKAKAFAKRFQIPTYYTDYRQMLEELTPDIISVCAYSGSRYEMIRWAVGFGVRSIFCEKPFASSLKETDQIITLCRKYRVNLLVNHTRRWGADYLTAKDLITNGKIGNVQTVSAVFSGDLFHTGTHMFDILHFLFGKTKSVQGWLGKKGKSAGNRYPTGPFEDYDGVALLKFSKNITAFISGLTKGYFIFELDIQGTRGRIRIGNHLFEVYETRKSKKYSGFKEIVLTDKKPKQLKKSALELAVEELIASASTSTGKDARNALEVAFGIIGSHKKGGKEVKLPLKKRTQKVLAR